MSIQIHLAALQRRHRAMEQQINVEQMHPSCDDLKVSELKRCKLALKDEIASVTKDANAIATKVRSARVKKKEAAYRISKRKSNSWYQYATQSIAIKSKSPKTQ